MKQRSLRFRCTNETNRNYSSLLHPQKGLIRTTTVQSCFCVENKDGTKKDALTFNKQRPFDRYYTVAGGRLAGRRLFCVSHRCVAVAKPIKYQPSSARKCALYNQDNATTTLIYIRSYEQRRALRALKRRKKEFWTFFAFERKYPEKKRSLS